MIIKLQIKRLFFWHAKHLSTSSISVLLKNSSLMDKKFFTRTVLLLTCIEFLVDNNLPNVLLFLFILLLLFLVDRGRKWNSRKGTTWKVFLCETSENSQKGTKIRDISQSVKELNSLISNWRMILYIPKSSDWYGSVVCRVRGKKVMSLIKTNLVMVHTYNILIKSKRVLTHYS